MSARRRKLTSRFVSLEPYSALAQSLSHKCSVGWLNLEHTRADDRYVRS